MKKNRNPIGSLLSTWKVAVSPSPLPERTCPEAIQHGPADGYGRCPWCRQKYTCTVLPPPNGWGEMTELSDAWGEHYDPDHGARSRDQIRQRYQTGQNP